MDDTEKSYFYFCFPKSYFCVSSVSEKKLTTFWDFNQQYFVLREGKILKFIGFSCFLAFFCTFLTFFSLFLRFFAKTRSRVLCA